MPLQKQPTFARRTLAVPSGCPLRDTLIEAGKFTFSSPQLPLVAVQICALYVAFAVLSNFVSDRPNTAVIVPGLLPGSLFSVAIQHPADSILEEPVLTGLLDGFAMKFRWGVPADGGTSAMLSYALSFLVGPFVMGACAGATMKIRQDHSPTYLFWRGGIRYFLRAYLFSFLFLPAAICMSVAYAAVVRLVEGVALFSASHVMAIALLAEVVITVIMAAPVSMGVAVFQHGRGGVRVGLRFFKQRPFGALGLTASLVAGAICAFAITSLFTYLFCWHHLQAASLAAPGSGDAIKVPLAIMAVFSVLAASLWWLWCLAALFAFQRKAL